MPKLPTHTQATQTRVRATSVRAMIRVRVTPTAVRATIQVRVRATAVRVRQTIEKIIWNPTKRTSLQIWAKKRKITKRKNNFEEDLEEEYA